MKENFTSEERRALIAYRRERAHETLFVARENLANERYSTAVNRTYYACFYIVLALFAQEGIDTKTHAGVKNMLGMHFVRTNRLSPKMQRIYSQLMDARGEGDYDDFTYFDHDTVQQYIDNAVEFIAEIETLIIEN